MNRSEAEAVVVRAAKEWFDELASLADQTPESADEMRSIRLAISIMKED